MGRAGRLASFGAALALAAGCAWTLAVSHGEPGRHPAPAAKPSASYFEAIPGHNQSLPLVLFVVVGDDQRALYEGLAYDAERIAVAMGTVVEHRVVVLASEDEGRAFADAVKADSVHIKALGQPPVTLIVAPS
jgi:hypothetical protein